MSGYGQFCPVARASEVFCRRWTPLVVRELLCGSRRFNEIQRGVPLMSPSLLSERLRELVRAGVVSRGEDGAYDLTDAGRELYGVVHALGEWGQRWARSEYRDEELDAGILLWDMHRFLQPAALGPGRCVIEFVFRGQPRGRRRYWLVTRPDDVDVCMVDPGFPVDVHVDADLRALTRVWMGDSTFDAEWRSGAIELEGPRELVRALPQWIGRHPILGHVARATPAEAAGTI